MRSGVSSCQDYAQILKATLLIYTFSRRNDIHMILSNKFQPFGDNCSSDLRLAYTPNNTIDD
jgi:hypothetical protein